MMTRPSNSLSLSSAALHFTRRSTLLSLNQTLQSSKAASVAHSSRNDGTQTSELLTLSPSQSSDNRRSAPSSSRRGSPSGMGLVVFSGVSGPKRSIDQVSSLSLEV